MTENEQLQIAKLRNDKSHPKLPDIPVNALIEALHAMHEERAASCTQTDYSLFLRKNGENK